jgi:hypothetical protein
VWPHTLTRLNVAVDNGTVDLVGIIDDEHEALEVTRLAADTDERVVVSWLEPPVATGSRGPRDSPAGPRRN